MDHPSFEQAYGRLEEILEALNSGKLSLDVGLQLYEEAERLIGLAEQKLRSAEKKIEMLLKNRTGGLALDAQGAPMREEFSLHAPPPQTAEGVGYRQGAPRP